jgi:glycosyltransferase involved in cell wall biosynthesis
MKAESINKLEENRKTKVLYYVQPYYLDCCVEVLKSVKNDVEVHLMIELTNSSKKTTIIDISDIDHIEGINDVSKLIDENKLDQYKLIFQKLNSVSFIVFKSKKAFSTTNAHISNKLIRYIKENQISIIHIDGLSPRLIYFLPIIKKCKLYLTMHDAVSHSGEKSWKYEFLKFIYPYFTDKIFFYTNFSMKQFLNKNSIYNKQVKILKMYPYTFIKQYIKNDIPEGNYILFFGRITKYKGIDMLLKSIRIVKSKYPNEKFVIAGKWDNISTLNKDLLKINSVDILNYHLPIEELADMISNAKFIVCPYKDASQSGVLMTALAMEKGVVATSVGGFPEYIDPGVNGLLADVNEIDFARKIIQALDNKYYLEFAKNIRISNHSLKYQEKELLKCYQD